MATTTSRTVEITVISGEDLRLNRKPIKKNAFATLRADGDAKFRTTDMDSEGGGYPIWNQKLVLDLPAQARTVTVEVQCKTSNGVRTIGTAKILVSDFVGGFVPESHMHFLSYRLRDYRGERNGVVNVSVKVKVPEYSSCSTTSSQKPRVVGFPVEESSFGGGVVTGVPVWCAYGRH